jgi:hypothetical protein
MAGIAAFFKFTARRGTPLVNAATYLLANLAREGGATSGHVVGASHATGAVVDFNAQASGHLSAHVVEFVHRKIDAKTCAASPATRAI